MSTNLDLSAAVEAAARDHYDRERVNLLTGERDGPDWDDVYPENRHAWREDALPYVAAAAAPLKAREVQLLAMFEAIGQYGEHLLTLGDRSVAMIGEALVKAARIARGESA